MASVSPFGIPEIRQLILDALDSAAEWRQCSLVCRDFAATVMPMIWSSFSWPTNASVDQVREALAKYGHLLRNVTCFSDQEKRPLIRLLLDCKCRRLESLNFNPVLSTSYSMALTLISLNPGIKRLFWCGTNVMPLSLSDLADTCPSLQNFTARHVAISISSWRKLLSCCPDLNTIVFQTFTLTSTLAWNDEDRHPGPKHFNIKTININTRGASPTNIRVVTILRSIFSGCPNLQDLTLTGQISLLQTLPAYLPASCPKISKLYLHAQSMVSEEDPDEAFAKNLMGFPLLSKVGLTADSVGENTLKTLICLAPKLTVIEVTCKHQKQEIMTDGKWAGEILSIGSELVVAHLDVLCDGNGLALGGSTEWACRSLESLQLYVGGTSSKLSPEQSHDYIGADTSEIPEYMCLDSCWILYDKVSKLNKLKSLSIIGDSRYSEEYSEFAAPRLGNGFEELESLTRLETLRIDRRNCDGLSWPQLRWLVKQFPSLETLMVENWHEEQGAMYASLRPGVDVVWGPFMDFSIFSPD